MVVLAGEQVPQRGRNTAANEEALLGGLVFPLQAQLLRPLQGVAGHVVDDLLGVPARPDQFGDDVPVRVVERAVPVIAASSSSTFAFVVGGESGGAPVPVGLGAVSSARV